eukprot:3419036-Ditylum_brightwellii.AAC.1
MDLAKLNLRAGEKAMSLATFFSAASYLKAGIGLLCDCHWEKQYDISLQLYSLYVEAEYRNGNFQEVGRAAGTVLREAKSFENKLRVFATLIKSLAAQNKVQVAIDIGFNVLGDLGVQCPSPLPEKSAIMKDVMEMKRMLENSTEADFLNYRDMNDSKMIAAMKFLQSLA